MAFSISVKQGRESCSMDDRCPEGMVCSDFRCECEEGTMTPDRKVCLKNNEKLLGQTCTPSSDICYQVTGRFRSKYHLLTFFK